MKLAVVITLLVVGVAYIEAQRGGGGGGRGGRRRGRGPPLVSCEDSDDTCGERACCVNVPEQYQEIIGMAKACMPRDTRRGRCADSCQCPEGQFCWKKDRGSRPTPSPDQIRRALRRRRFPGKCQATSIGAGQWMGARPSK